MSTARLESITEPAHHHIVRRTIEACHLAKEAAGAAAEGIATGSASLLSSQRHRERELDTLDMEIDSAVTSIITEVGPNEARQLLACMKFMISLERIGDLLLSFANSAQAAAGRIDSEDTRDLTHMATILEKMLTDVGEASPPAMLARRSTCSAPTPRSIACGISFSCATSKIPRTSPARPACRSSL